MMCLKTQGETVDLPRENNMYLLSHIFLLFSRPVTEVVVKEVIALHIIEIIKYAKLTTTTFYL